jgi:hypothetical protein
MFLYCRYKLSITTWTLAEVFSQKSGGQRGRSYNILRMLQYKKYWGQWHYTALIPHSLNVHMKGLTKTDNTFKEKNDTNFTHLSGIIPSNRMKFKKIEKLRIDFISCSIWSSHSGGYEEFYLLGYNAVAMFVICFHATFLFGLFFDLKDGGDMFLRNVGWLSTDDTALYRRR